MNPQNAVRVSISDGIQLELDRYDNETVPTTSISIEPNRNPDKFTVSLKGVSADHVFVVDTHTGSLETLLFLTQGSATPWKMSK